jgi:shikimate kinase
MRISLIGMSNIGKSTWAKRIAAHRSCDALTCDALIEKKLKVQLAEKGVKGLRGMATWMGFPYDPHYAVNSALYLTCEKEVMAETLERLEQNVLASIVIDTTGSVIYTGTEMLLRLRALTRVIYFESSDAHVDELFKRFLDTPKPVIWGDRYKPRKGETPAETLKRCYPLLLQERALRYHELAHITIPFEQHRNRKADIEELIVQQMGSV